MQVMVAQYFMDVHSSRDYDLWIDDVVELPAEEVYEDFCRIVWSFEPIRPSLRILHMQPAAIS
jgi:hypothetical protein